MPAFNAILSASEHLLGPGVRRAEEATLLVSKLLEDSTQLPSRILRSDAAVGTASQPSSLSGLDPIIEQMRKQDNINWSGTLDVLKQHGAPADMAIARAARDSRVIGLGEVHAQPGDHFDPIRRHAGNMMPELRKNGVTHVGIELPTVTKPIFDKFNLGAGDLELPAELHGDGGQAALDILGGMKMHNPAIVSAWIKARNSGLKIVPIDNWNLGGQAREEFMRDRVTNVLGQQGTNSVLTWLGNMHMADSRGAAQIKSMAELLKAEAAKRGERVTTFGTAIDHWGEETVFQSASTPLTHAVSRVTAVPTRTADGGLNDIGRIPLQKFGLDWRRHHFDHQPFDYLVIHPSPVKERLADASALSKLETEYSKKMLEIAADRLPQRMQLPNTIGGSAEKPASFGQAEQKGSGISASRSPQQAKVQNTSRDSAQQAADLERSNGTNEVDFYSSQAKRIFPADQGELRNAGYRVMMHRAGIHNYAGSTARDITFLEQHRPGIVQQLDGIVSLRSSSGA